MISHTVYSQSLSASCPHIRVEVVFESTPVFAGDSLCAIVKFRNVKKCGAMPAIRKSRTPLSGRTPLGSAVSLVSVAQESEDLLYKSRWTSAHSIHVGSVVNDGAAEAAPSRSVSYGDISVVGSEGGVNVAEGAERSEIVAETVAEEAEPRDSRQRILENITESDRKSDSESELHLQSEPNSAIDPNMPKNPINQPQSSPNSAKPSHSQPQTPQTPLPSANPTESLLLGYIQLFGYLVAEDPEIINPQTFSATQKRTIVGGALGGVAGLEISHPDKPGLLSGLTAGFESLWSKFDFQSRNPQHPEYRQHLPGYKRHPPERILPIFSTPRSLAFTEISLAPGESRSFLYRLNLPRELPPSCPSGRAVSVAYDLIIGAERHGENFTPECPVVAYPLRVMGYMDGDGYCPEFRWESPIIELEDTCYLQPISGLHAEFRDFGSGNARRKTETERITEKAEARELVVESMRKFYGMHYGNRAGIVGEGKPSSVAQAQTEAERQFWRGCAEIGAEGQFIESGGSGESGDNGDSGDSGSRVAENVTLVMQKLMMKRSGVTAGLKLNPFYSDPRSRYEITCGGQLVTIVTLTRNFYRIGDRVAVSLELNNAAWQYACHLAVLCLETSEEVGNGLAQMAQSDQSLGDVAEVAEERAEVAEGSEEAERRAEVATTKETRKPFWSAREISYRTKQEYDKVSASCHNVDLVTLDLNIPLNATPTFSMQDFRFRWYLGLNLIISKPEKATAEPPKLLRPVYADELGVRYSGVPAMPCMDFYCRIPINVIPSNVDFSGLIVKR